MKKYRLLKDKELPGIEKDEEILRYNEDNECYQFYNTSNGCWLLTYSFSVNFIDLHPEWFEEVKEEKTVEEIIAICLMVGQGGEAMEKAKEIARDLKENGFHVVQHKEASDDFVKAFAMEIDSAVDSCVDSINLKSQVDYIGTLKEIIKRNLTNFVRVK